MRTSKVPESKYVIPLNQLNSDKINVLQALSYIEEFNSRVPKIIDNCLSNMQKNKQKRDYTKIESNIYEFQIPLRPPGTSPEIPYDIQSNQDL